MLPARTVCGHVGPVCVLNSIRCVVRSIASLFELSRIAFSFAHSAIVLLSLCCPLFATFLQKLAYNNIFFVFLFLFFLLFFVVYFLICSLFTFSSVIRFLYILIEFNLIVSLVLLAIIVLPLDILFFVFLQHVIRYEIFILFYYVKNCTIVFGMVNFVRW